MNPSDLMTGWPKRRSAERGQTLLLWALSLLVLVLMVCMVLSVGTRVREKIETQTLADTAAYSNAVATARTFNIISLMNRTQISHMVAQAGAQSLMSWSANYVSALSAVHFDMTLNVASMPCVDFFCICGNLSRLLLTIESMAFWIEEFAALSMFLPLEIPATVQAKQRWYASMALFALENESYFMDLRGNLLGGQTLPSKVLNGAKAATFNGGAELNANISGADQVTMRETGVSIGCLTGSGVVCNPPVDSEHAVEAAMGSRGYPFVTARTYSDMYLTARLNEVLARYDWGVVNTATTVLQMGAGYFSWVFWFPSHGIIPPAMGTFSQADDHGGVMLDSQGPCSGTASPPMPTLSWIRSGNQVMQSQHTYLLNPFLAFIYGFQLYPGGIPAPPVPWTPLPGPPIPVQEPDGPVVHRASDLPWFGIWPLFIDYSWGMVKDGNDNFGQPKNMAIVQRDYSVRQPDPYNLFFNFRFTPTGSKFDNRGIQLSTAPYTDISKMTAVATGITYYHRGGHWKEPPNFLSPFWRATLVAADTDQQGTGMNSDSAQLMNGIGQPDAAQLWNGLQQQGFKGVH